MRKIIGYARQGRLDDTLIDQMGALTGAGCENIFVDKTPTTDKKRINLKHCLSVLDSGDILVVCSLVKLGSSLKHLVEIFNVLQQRGIKLKCLDNKWFDTTIVDDEILFHVFEGLAKFEKELIAERTKKGLAAARARGRKGGRKRITTSDERVQKVKELSKDKSKSVGSICDLLRISRATYYRFVEL